MSVTRLKGREGIVARYGSVRSFTLRLLYSWLTLTMLWTFAWPLLVLLTSAPGVTREETPTGWFQLRLLAPLLTAAAAGWIWHLSPVPTATADRGRMLALVRAGRVWPQVLLFLVGLPLVLSGFLLAEDAGGALKLISLTLAEAIVIQIILSGYLHGAFDLLLPDSRPELPVIGLYALTFALRNTLAASAEETLPQGELLLAASGGIVAGALVGVVSVWLRARSGSLLPGILALWLLFLLLGLGDFYES
jgi:hypothetical protein